MLTVAVSRRELFESARKRWPSSMVIISGVSGNEANVVVPSDVETYKSIEDSISPEDDWSQIAAWSFHQALHHHINNISPSIKKISVESVSFEMFDKMMLSNLQHETWADERLQYTSMP